MSKKTLNKRISLVAVTALTAGLFSVVAPSVANAGYGSNVATSSATNPALAVADTLYIAVVPTVTGSATGLTGVANTALASTPAVTSASSLGLVNVSDLAAGLTAGTTTTAVLLSTGAISVYASNTTDTAGTIVVTGGTLSAGSGSADAINSTATVAAAGTNTDVRNWGVVVKPSSGVSSMTIAYYSGYTKTATAATDNAALLANPTGATGLSLQGQITVTVTSSSVAGTLSAAKSTVYGAANGTQATLEADAATYLGAANWTNDLFASVRIRDAFGVAISGATGLLQVSASNGALVNVEAGSVAADGTQSTDFVSTASPDTAMIQVSAPDSAPRITTITVSWNGTVVGTKTMQFTGKVAKVDLYSPVIGATSNTTSNFVYYKLSDAAGNPTYTTISAIAVSAYPYATLSENVAARSGVVTALAKERNYNLASNYSTVTTGRAQFTCGATAGAGTIGLTFTNLDGSVVNSNTLSVKCAGGAVTYKAAWDKASYTPGDLATLKITGYDSKGNVANDVAAISTTLPVVAIGGLDKTITGPTTTDVLDGGSVSYKYTVGATEGTYAGKVTFTTIDERYASDISTAGADAVTITLKVASATATVSNADVLKSIVALIASINKQIQALQKLILKR